MKIRLICPNCSKRGHIEEAVCRRMVRCPSCGERFHTNHGITNPLTQPASATSQQDNNLPNEEIQEPPEGRSQPHANTQLIPPARPARWVNQLTNLRSTVLLGVIGSSLAIICIGAFLFFEFSQPHSELPQDTITTAPNQRRANVQPTVRQTIEQNTRHAKLDSPKSSEVQPPIRHVVEQRATESATTANAKVSGPHTGRGAEEYSDSSEKGVSI